MKRYLLGATLVLLTGSCSATEIDVDCEQLVDKYVQLLEFPVDAAERGEYMAQCRAKPPSAAEQRCLLGAVVLPDLELCTESRLPAR